MSAARSRYTEARELAQALGQHGLQAIALDASARVCGRLGLHDQALRDGQLAAEAFERFGALAKAGKPARAQRLHDTSVRASSIDHQVM